MKKNARFWHWNREEWCKITLRPGQVLNWTEYHSDGEGSLVEYVSFKYDGEFVYFSSLIDGRDCDGRMAHWFEYKAHVEKLKDVSQMAELISRHEVWGTELWPSEVAVSKGIHTPAWEVVDTGRRDYAAERAGY